MSRWASRSPRSHEYNTARLGGGEVYRGRCAYGPSGSEHATTTTGEPPLRYGPERPNDAPAPRLRAGPAWRPVRYRAAPGRRDGGGPLHQVRRPRGDQAGRRRRPPAPVRGREERLLVRGPRLRRGLADPSDGPSRELRVDGVLRSSTRTSRKILHLSVAPSTACLLAWCRQLMGRALTCPPIYKEVAVRRLINVGFVSFSDPDGNRWAVHQISFRG